MTTLRKTLAVIIAAPFALLFSIAILLGLLLGEGLAILLDAVEKADTRKVKP